MSRYELRLEGRLDEHWSAWFSGLTLTYEDGTTVLRGVVADQAELHGVLFRVRDLGATLVALSRLDVPDPTEPLSPPRAPPAVADGTPGPPPAARPPTRPPPGG